MKAIGKIIHDLIADDKDLIIYRPALRSITKSIPSAILLSQIMYWDKDARKKGKTKFYKFKTPPETANPKYKEGDSWCEELNMSPKEFDNALKNIGSKFSKSIPKDPKSFVWYNTDMNRVTWYQINTVHLRKSLILLYDENAENPKENDVSRKCTIDIYVNEEKSSRIYTENTDRDHSLRKLAKANLPVGTGRVELNGLVCKICGEEQYETPSGATCNNHHGGAEGVEPHEYNKKPTLFKGGRIGAPKLKKIEPSPLTKFNYSINAKRILKCWENFTGRLHVNGNVVRGAEKVNTIIDELLMDGLNTCYSKMTRDPKLKQKKWTVQEICDCIEFYAGEDGLNKDIEEWYFDSFIVRRFGRFGGKDRRDHSPLLDSFKSLPEKSTSKWAKILLERFHETFPKATIYNKSIYTIASFLESKVDDFKITDPSQHSFLPNMFLNYMKQEVSVAGKYDPIKYMASQTNIDKFWNGLIKSFKAKKRTPTEKAQWIKEKPIREENRKKAQAKKGLSN